MGLPFGLCVGSALLGALAFAFEVALAEEEALTADDFCGTFAVATLATLALSLALAFAPLFALEEPRG
jgi:hypothetical protein